MLEVYDVATGARVRSLPIPVGFRLGDVDGGTAVLLATEAITLLRLDDGTSRTLAPGRAPVLADLEPAGLYYSYATGDGGGRVVSCPSVGAPVMRACVSRLRRLLAAGTFAALVLVVPAATLHTSAAEATPLARGATGS